MKIQVELKDFTPLLDTLVSDHGIVTAAVYGAVWRYAQMKDRVCRASLEKIAGRVKVSSKTAERHIKKLCEAGYLEDLTPKIKNKPHIYIVTGKAELAGAVSSGIRSDRESYQGQTESLTRSDRESYQGQTESLLKKHIKKDKEDILKPKTSPPQKPILDENVTSQHTDDQRKALNTLAPIIADQANDGSVPSLDELRTVTLLGYEIAQYVQLDILAVANGELKALAAQTLRLYAKPNIAAKLKAHSQWWYNEYWLGKDKGQPPSLKQLGSTWGQFEAAKVAPPQNNAAPNLTDAELQRYQELVAANS